jgi:hypothetical protein
MKLRSLELNFPAVLCVLQANERRVKTTDFVMEQSFNLNRPTPGV